MRCAQVVHCGGAAPGPHRHIGGEAARARALLVDHIAVVGVGNEDAAQATPSPIFFQ